MTPAHRRYLVAEGLISVLFNSILSLLAAWIVFRGRAVVPAMGAEGFALDFLPQTFMITLMSTLIPGLLTRRRLRSGAIAPLAFAGPSLPRNIPLRALLIAFVTTVLVGGAALLLSPAVFSAPLTLNGLFAMKVLFGAVLCVPVTLFGLRVSLAG